MTTHIDVKELDEPALFAQAIEVMNRAIDENKHRTPYKQVMAASEKLIGDKPIGVALTGNGRQPYDYYTVRFEHGRISLEGRGKRDDPGISWRVSREYLEKVASDPDGYVEHPEKLDFDWLKDRLGIG